jgi:hypothetical protein
MMYLLLIWYGVCGYVPSLDLVLCLRMMYLLLIWYGVCGYTLLCPPACFHLTGVHRRNPLV